VILWGLGVVLGRRVEREGWWGEGRFGVLRGPSLPMCQALLLHSKRGNSV